MKEELIKIWMKENKLRPKQIDLEKIKSLISSAKSNADITLKIKLEEKSATVIFRELYECIRQLSEALWMLNGYEPKTHEIALESLKELEIKNRLKLNHLDRYRKIRHDINYQGFQATLEQAKEILDFWKTAGKEILMVLEKEI
jgi:hypothetical protein